MDKSYIDEYEQFELHHWWHTARRAIIHGFLDRYGKGNAARRWLDIGCGTGVLLNSYDAIPHKMGVELDDAAVERAQAKGLSVVTTGRTWDLTPHGRFDLVTMCDVIEHLPDERAALDAAWSALEPGGIALVTVPAVKGLWSSHDVINHHYRRYDRDGLRDVFDMGKWRILRLSYFCSLLFPLIFTARKLKNARQRLLPGEHDHDFGFGPPLLDDALYSIFSAEKALLEIGDLPIGSSLIAIAQRRLGDPSDGDA